MNKRRLTEILPDENEQWHIFAAARNRVCFFVTVDFRTILSRRERVMAASGAEPVTPAEFVAHSSSSLRGPTSRSREGAKSGVPVNSNVSRKES